MSEEDEARWAALTAKPVDEIITAYHIVKTALEAEAKVWDEREAFLKSKLKRMESALIAKAHAEGTTGFKTPMGTAYIRNSLKANIADFGVFSEWVLANRAIHFMQKRVSIDSVKSYMEEHDGRIPPGISTFTEEGMTITKPRAK
jgi:hypothetical protein